MPKRLAMTILCAPQYIDESAGIPTRRAGMAKSKWIKAFDGGDRRRRRQGDQGRSEEELRRLKPSKTPGKLAPPRGGAFV
jgi:hypothetical protein